jgi:hypothetical protein
MQADSNRSETQRINLNIHYLSQNIGRITIYQNGDWLDDMVALELLSPDSRSLKQVSKLERKIASVLAKQAGESSREWVYWIAR